MKKAFTLLEMLVVVAIIGILSTLVVSNLVAARQRARDAQRKNDLKQMRAAFELYSQDQSPLAYPTSAPNGVGGSPILNVAVNSPFTSTSGLTTYMQSVPGDPVSSNAYYYNSAGTNPPTYTLAACLENKSDPSAASCPAGFPGSCSVCFVLTNP